MQPKRKLAAILFVDIAGYTTQANQDERRALEIREEVERLVKSSTLGHLGRVVKTLGDGAMLEFASAVEAVTCALEIQEHMGDLNRRLALEQPVLVRIGAHVGDVVEEDDDLFGNAVNIASRVLGMAQPGGICITREVYVQIRPILNLHCTPVTVSGEKSFPEPVEVFAIDGIESPRSSMRARRKFLVYSLATLGVLAVVYAAMMATGTNGPLIGEPRAAHRLLLPDWVSPGDWFPLDTGEEGKRYKVYLGNVEADTRIESGQLLVRVPPNIPSNQTTISVFKDDDSRPLMTQMTQVINPVKVASNDSDPSTQLIMGTGKKPRGAVEEGSLSAGPADSAANHTQPPVPPATPSLPNSKVTGGPPAPGPRDGTRPIGHLSRMGVPKEGYEKFVMAFPNHDFKGVELNLEGIPGISDEVKRAMTMVTYAAQGKDEKCQVTMKEVKSSMKGLDPAMAKEIESLVKSAQALIAERSKAARPEIRRKYADAFAFSINNGTNNLAGLTLVDRLIKDEEFEEARRTVDFMKKRGNLNEAESKALAKLEDRIKRGPAPSGAPGGE